MAHYGPRAEFHHGDCVGADYEAAFLAREIGYRVVGHPPLVQTKRGFFACDELCLPKKYLDRNRDIVDACSVLVAAPKESQETVRSGTWATVRYARKIGRAIEMVRP